MALHFEKSAIPSLIAIKYLSTKILCIVQKCFYGQHGYSGIFGATLSYILPLGALETILRHAQVHAMRNAADCPKVLIFHVSMSKIGNRI